MKILHIMLANFFIDNHSYQENMLTKYHKKIGYDVEVIASLFNFDENGEGYFDTDRREYFNENNIPVTRLEFKSGILNKRLRRYKGTQEAIKKAQPNIIFIHGCQFIDIIHVINYAKNNPEVKIYVDNHADFSNSARNFLSKNILHKIIWRKCAQLVEPYTDKFYGVLPARVDFLKNIYNLPEEKVELLVMGADDDRVKEVNKLNTRKLIREKYGIKENDFLIVTGGKIDQAKKQTILLLEAINKSTNKNLKIIFFGSIIPELKKEVLKYTQNNRIKYVGWINSEDSYNYFSAADLVVFPGRHSVFWEQVVGQGVPMLVKYWEGTTHININGSCQFLYEDNVDEIEKKLCSIIDNEEEYNKMKASSLKYGMNIFSYYSIASRSISM